MTLPKGVTEIKAGNGRKYWVVLHDEDLSHPCRYCIGNNKPLCRQLPICSEPMHIFIKPSMEAYDKLAVQMVAAKLG